MTKVSLDSASSAEIPSARRSRCTSSMASASCPSIVVSSFLVLCSSLASCPCGANLRRKTSSKGSGLLPFLSQTTSSSLSFSDLDFASTKQMSEQQQQQKEDEVLPRDKRLTIDARVTGAWDPRTAFARRAADFAKALATQGAAAVALAQNFPRGGDADADEASLAQFKAARDAASEALAKALDDFLAPENALAAQAAQRLQRRRKRAKILAELLATEEDFGRDVGLLLSVWDAELRRRGDACAAEDCDAMFAEKLPALARVSAALADAFRRAPDEPCRLCAALRAELLPHVRLFVMHYVDAHQVLERLERSPKFREAARQIQAEHAELRSLDLGAFLIKPTQRAMKFPLFLKDLHGCTEDGDALRADIERLQDELRERLAEVNDEKRARETVIAVEKLRDVEWRPASGGGIDFAASKSRFSLQDVAHGQVVPKDPAIPPQKVNRIWLFDNVLLALNATKGRLQEVATFPTDGLRFLEQKAPASASGDAKVKIVIVHSKLHEALIIETEHSGAARMWTNALNDILKAPSSNPLVMLPPKTPLPPASAAPAHSATPTLSGNAAGESSSGTSESTSSTSSSASSSSKHHLQKKSRRKSIFGSFLSGGSSEKRAPAAALPLSASLSADPNPVSEQQKAQQQKQHQQQQQPLSSSSPALPLAEPVAATTEEQRRHARMPSWVADVLAAKSSAPSKEQSSRRSMTREDRRKLLVDRSDAGQKARPASTRDMASLVEKEAEASQTPPPEDAEKKKPRVVVRVPVAAQSPASTTPPTTSTTTTTSSSPRLTAAAIAGSTSPRLPDPIDLGNKKPQQPASSVVVVAKAASASDGSSAASGSKPGSSSASGSGSRSGSGSGTGSGSGSGSRSGSFSRSGSGSGSGSRSGTGTRTGTHSGTGSWSGSRSGSTGSGGSGSGSGTRSTGSSRSSASNNGGDNSSKK